jgi:hypothetical protein
MGLFDAINSIFGSSAGQKAAEQAQQANIAALNTYSGKANDLFNQYKTSSLGSLGEGLTGSLGELDKATGAITTGLDSATAAGRAGVAAWDPLSQVVRGYDPAVDAYYKGLGLQGPQGQEAVNTMFRNQPGYQFQQDEAARAIAANAAKLGISASGNTLQTLGDRSQNIADTTYNDYLTRLGAFVPLQQQGATSLGAGLTGANKTLADIFSSGGSALAGVYGAKAGVYGQNAQNQVDVFGNTVQGQTQAARDVSQGTLASNNAVAQAKQQDAANNMGFWASLAGAAGNAFKPSPGIKTA